SRDVASADVMPSRSRSTSASSRARSPCGKELRSTRSRIASRSLSRIALTPLVVADKDAVQSVGHHAICDGRTVPARNLHHVRSQCLVPGLPLVDDADVHAAVDVLTGGAGETRLQPVSVVNHDLHFARFGLSNDL